MTKCLPLERSGKYFIINLIMLLSQLNYFLTWLFAILCGRLLLWVITKTINQISALLIASTDTIVPMIKVLARTFQRNRKERSVFARTVVPRVCRETKEHSSCCKWNWRMKICWLIKSKAKNSPNDYRISKCSNKPLNGRNDLENAD